MTTTLADSGQRRPFPKPVVAWLLPDGAGWARPDDYTVGVISTVALRLEVDRNWVHRNLAAGGLGVYVADAVAIHLRVHPVSIWPDWFEHAPAEEQVLAAEASERQRATRREAHRRHEGTGPLVGGLTDADRAAAWAVHDELRTPLSELFLQWCQQEAPKAS
jgi:hypothetical protein